MLTTHFYAGEFHDTGRNIMDMFRRGNQASHVSDALCDMLNIPARKSNGAKFGYKAMTPTRDNCETLRPNVK